MPEELMEIVVICAFLGVGAFAFIIIVAAYLYFVSDL
jgi:hypothetical protein